MRRLALILLAVVGVGFSGGDPADSLRPAAARAAETPADSPLPPNTPELEALGCEVHCYDGRPDVWLSGNDATDQTVAKIIPLVSDYPWLGLRLYGSEQITDESLRQVGRLENLRTLTFYRTAISGEGLETPSGFLHLEQLTLRDNPRLNAEGLETLSASPELELVEVTDSPLIGERALQLFAGKAQLEDLVLGNIGRVTDAGLADLKDLPNLRELRITGGEISQEGLRPLSRFGKLERLCLADLALTARDPSPLEGLPELRKLSIEGGEVTEEGLRSVAGLGRLEELTLWKTRVADEDLLPLKSMSGLRSLTIRPIIARIEVVEDLQRALPEADIQVGGPTRLVDLTTGQVTRTMPALHLSGAFSGDWSRMADFFGNVATIYNLRSGAFLREITCLPPGVKSNKSRVHRVALSSDGSALAVALDDRSVRIWDVESGLETCVLPAHPGNVYSLMFSPGGHWLLVGGRTMRIWELATATPWWETSDNHSTPLCFWPNDERLVRSTRGNVETYDVLARKLVSTWTPSGAEGEFRTFCVDSAGRLVGFVGSPLTGGRLYDITSQRLIREVPVGGDEHGGRVFYELIPGPQPSLLSRTDTTLCLTDMNTAETRHRFELHDDSFARTHVSPDGKQLLFEVIQPSAPR